MLIVLAEKADFSIAGSCKAAFGLPSAIISYSMAGFETAFGFVVIVLISSFVESESIMSYCYFEVFSSAHGIILAVVVALKSEDMSM